MRTIFTLITLFSLVNISFSQTKIADQILAIVSDKHILLSDIEEQY